MSEELYVIRKGGYFCRENAQGKSRTEEGMKISLRFVWAIAVISLSFDILKIAAGWGHLTSKQYVESIITVVFFCMSLSASAFFWRWLTAKEGAK